jgi:hypothetical protein
MSDPMNRDHAAGDETRPLGDELFDDRATASGDRPTAPLPSTPAGRAPSGAASDDAATSPLDMDPATSSSPSDPSGRPVGSEAPTTGPVSGPLGAPEPPPRPRGPRVATIVWGFVIVAFGAVVLAAAMGARVDMGLAAILVLALAGVTLVVGSIVSGARRRRG